MSAQPIDRTAAALLAAVDDLRTMDGELWRLGGAELGDRMTALEDLRRLCEAQQVAVAQEALGRGETGASGPSALARAGVKAWTTHRFGECTVGGPAEPGRVATIATVATGLVAANDGREVLGTAVRSGEVQLLAARTCLGEMDRLADLLVEDAKPAVWNAYTQLAATQPVRVVAALRESMLARWGHDERIERDHETARRHAALGMAQRDGALRKYSLVLDVDASVRLEAAVGSLSAPTTGPDGEPDLRTPEQRRAEALMLLVGRGIAAAAGLPGPTKAALYVTADWEDLVGGQGGGAVVGSTEDGTVLPASTIRRLACDAWLIPVAVGSRDVRCTGRGGGGVGGSAFGGGSDVGVGSDGPPGPAVPGQFGSVLDVGPAVRLFTIHQRRALMIRDRRCTFPGCEVPATWADAHHLRHWVDGGRTELGNAALLCERHHTLVHRLRLFGWVDEETRAVRWDLTPDSYDRALAAARAAEDERP